jgi:hypothetical protein
MWREYWWIILLAILIVPLICIAAFSWWLRRRPDVDLEKGVKCWDVFVKLISALTIVVSGAMLLGKYIDQQQTVESEKIVQQGHEQNLRKAEFLRQELQFDTDRYNKKKTLFDEVKVLAAKLANTDSPDKVTIDRFDQLYFGALIGVEESRGPVETAMVLFRRKLKKQAGAPEDSLEQLALQLSGACETELKAAEDSLKDKYRHIADTLSGVGTK